MTDCGNDRDLTGIYGPCDALVVESEEVFIRTAAPCDDDDVNVLLFST